MTLQDIAEMNEAAFALHQEKFEASVSEELRVALEQLIAEQEECNKTAT